MEYRGAQEQSAGLEKGSWNAYPYCPVDDSGNMKLTEERGALVCPI